MRDFGSAQAASSSNEVSSPLGPGPSGIAGDRPFSVAIRDAVTATMAGEPGGANRLFTLLRPWLLAGMQARDSEGQPGHGDGDLEDLTQDICLAILRSLPNYQATHNFLSWVFRIASGTMATFYTRRDRDRSTPTEQTPDSPALDDDPEHHAELAVQHDELATLVDRHLRGTSRKVLHHRFLNDLSVGETAAAMGITSNHVRVLQHRALTKLRAVVNYDPTQRTVEHRAERADEHHVVEHVGVFPSRRRRATTTRVRSSTHVPSWPQMSWSSPTPRCPTCLAEVVLADGGWSCPRCTHPEAAQSQIA